MSDQDRFSESESEDFVDAPCISMEDCSSDRGYIMDSSDVHSSEDLDRDS